MYGSNPYAAIPHLEMVPDKGQNALFSAASYTVGWVAALPCERAAALVMLDEQHSRPKDFVQNKSDPNNYTWGKAAGHNVVVASLLPGEYGTVSAMSTASGLRASFPHIRIGLFVGIGAGVPNKAEILLGDVVVSTPNGTNGGVVQYDLYKAKNEGGNSVRERKGFLDNPPFVLRAALGTVRAQHEISGSEVEGLLRSFRDNERMREPYGFPGVDKDDLRRGAADPRLSPEIHYGTIASGNTLIKDASQRDGLVAWLKEDNITPLCFEMEAAGLMNCFPCLVIRGICDYADEHKDDSWQRYAAATAAAFAKELLGYVGKDDVEQAAMLKDVLKDVRDLREEIQAGFSAVESVMNETKFIANKVNDSVATIERHELQQKILAWLNPSDPSANFNKAIEMRHPGTGQWLLDSSCFRSWHQAKNSFLWLYGLPGCGKTILSSTILRYLRSKSNSPAICLYFFFDFSDASKQSLDNAVRSLVWQLHLLNDQTYALLGAQFDIFDKGKRQPPTKQLCDLFNKMIAVSGNVHIVLDALDECGTPWSRTESGLYPWLRALVSNHGDLHVLVTSRPEHDIRTNLEQWTETKDRVPVEGSNVDKDLKSYVYSEVEAYSKRQRWNDRPELKALVSRTLCDGACGMFRWVYCQLQVLAECVDQPSLITALQILPQTLTETYQRFIDGIPPIHQRQALLILRLLTYSERPLHVDEIVDAIAVSENEEIGFNPANRLFDPYTILKICPSLITIASIQGKGEMVKLAHFSVQEYIMQQSKIAGAMSLEETQSRRAIASVMVTYLEHVLSLEDLRDVDKEFPFARYCAQYLPENLRLGGETSDALVNRAVSIFTSSRRYKALLELYHPDEPLMESGTKWNELPAPVYYTASNGLYACMSAILDDGAEVNAQGGMLGNALQAAIHFDHEDLVDLLLDLGVDVNASGGEYGSALLAAVIGGQERTVKALLDKGADLNVNGDIKMSQWSSWPNALSAAAFSGHVGVVRLLLSAGADVDAEDDFYGGALDAAVQMQEDAVVQLLLDANADPDGKSGPYGIPLHAAARQGYKATVKILLDGGADVHARSASEHTALHNAAFEGHLAIARLLLDRRAEVNVRSALGCTALHLAAIRGHDALVDLLLRSGAEVNISSDDWASPLTCAAHRGYKKILKLLLDHGADVDVRGGPAGWNALDAALDSKNEGIVELLLDDKADVQT